MENATQIPVSINRSSSDSRSPGDLPALSAIDETRYRDNVLLLSDGETEDDLEKRLVDEAHGLGVLTDADILFSSRLGSLHSQSWLSVSTTKSASLNSTSYHPFSANDRSSSFPDTPTSPGNRVLGSVDSATSLSTCPSSYSSGAGMFMSPAATETLKVPVSHNTRATGLSRLGNKDSKIRFGLKQAIGKIPSFRRRSSNALPLTPLPDPPETKDLKELDVDSEQGCDTCDAARDGADSQHPPALDEEAVLRNIACDELTKMRDNQRAQRDRYLEFQRHILDSIATRYQDMREKRRAQNDEDRKTNAEQNKREIVRLEESQLTAEFSLLEEFEREKVSLQTCIRHMEAYFENPGPPPLSSEAGNNPPDDSSQPQRQFTSQQKDHLKQKYHERDTMDSLHQAKIKVLRDKQDRKYQEAIRRLDKAAIELSETNQQLYEDLEKHCQDEIDDAVSKLELKKGRLKRIWMLEEAIARKKLEIASGQSYGALPELSFVDLESETNAPVAKPARERDGSAVPNDDIPVISTEVEVC